MNISNKLTEAELKEITDLFKENYDRLQVDIMFVRKSNSAREKYKIYMFPCQTQDVKQMIINSLAVISDATDKRRMDNYDLVVSLDETIQIIEKSKVINADNVLSKITTNYTDKNTIGDNIKFNLLDFGVIQLSLNNADCPKITIFKKHISMNSKFKNSLKYTFNGRVAVPVEKELLIIGSNVEAVLVGDFFYILHRNYFNSMLDFKDVYEKIIDDHTGDIKDSGLLNDADAFIEKCKTNGKYTARFTKAILVGGFENVKAHHANIGTIIRKHSLNLELDAGGNIIYKEDNINEILNLLLQHYVTSDLTEQSLIAKAIENYT